MAGGSEPSVGAADSVVVPRVNSNARAAAALLVPAGLRLQGAFCELADADHGLRDLFVGGPFQHSVRLPVNADLARSRKCL
ncbi:MAG: hypothetical protein P8R42_06125 [Candidatus Binatia bacterium]|nr:hypothetical protein [Candidatus Binatia bacterium]